VMRFSRVTREPSGWKSHACKEQKFLPLALGPTGKGEERVRLLCAFASKALSHSLAIRYVPKILGTLFNCPEPQIIHLSPMPSPLARIIPTVCALGPPLEVTLGFRVWTRKAGGSHPSTTRPS
jgi:hypothetical protein